MLCRKCYSLLPISDIEDGHILCFYCFHDAIAAHRDCNMLNAKERMTPVDEQQFRSMALTKTQWVNGDSYCWALQSVLDELTRLRLELKRVKDGETNKC